MKKSAFKLAGSAIIALSLLVSGCGSSETTSNEKTNNGGSAPAQSTEAPSKAEAKSFSVGAGSQGGVYYPVAVGVSDIINKKLEGVTFTPEVTGASSENAVLLGNEEVEIAILTAGDIQMAKDGSEPFNEKYENISIMFGGLKPGAVQVVALKDSGIKSIADLKGKRVALGPQGGAGWKVFADMLPYYDMSLDDIKPSYIAYGDSVEQLSDKTLDAAVIVAGLPTPAITQLGASNEFALIPFEEEKLNKFLEEHKYLMPVTVKKDTYKGIIEDVKTYATVNVVAIRDDIDADTVYNITKTIFDNVENLQQSHPSVKTISIESASQFKGFRYHPGSVKYFKEKGIEVPAQ